MRVTDAFSGSYAIQSSSNSPVEKITKYEIDKMVATEIELECLIVSIVDGLRPPAACSPLSLTDFLQT